jgi:pimeloyl-ACP methyl ester carboxylesterase
MGGIVGSLYAGIRPDRVSHLASLEGFGLPATSPDQAPARYQRWLDEQLMPAPMRLMADFDEVAARLRRNNPRLPVAWAEWLAPHLAEAAGEGVRYRADPKHRWVNPVLYRLEEAQACWRGTAAKILWLAGDEATLLKWLKESPDEFAARRACYAQLEFEALADCGHNLHHDAPVEVARRLAAFVTD